VRGILKEEPPTPGPQPTPYRRSAQSLGLNLDDIRKAALQERANIAHTIADLEAWVMEVEATIAFLKSPRQI
jgi:hypothetical protein